MLKLEVLELKAIDSRQTNGYAKTISACTKADYRPAGRQMAVKTIGACTEAGYRPADRQMAI